MKNICLFFFLFISFQLLAQENNNSFKLGIQMGNTSHIGASGLGYHAQYDRAVADRFSVGIGFGQLYGSVTRQGTSSGTAGGVYWSETYEIYSSEGANYAEINGLYSYSKWRNFIDLKIGGGVTFLSNWLNYDKDVTILRGVIISAEETRHRDDAVMLNVVLDNDFKLNDRLFINWKFIFRKVINDQESLEIKTFYGGSGRGTSRSEVDSLIAMVIGLGYRF